MPTPSITQAAEAMRILFDVQVSYASPRRLADQPATVVAFIRGENHLRAADALIVNQKGAASMTSTDLIANTSVVTIKLPEGIQP